MKEELRDIWLQSDKNSAQMALDEWAKKAAVSGVNMLIKFSKTIAAHRSGILAYFDFEGLSTGPLEGANNNRVIVMNRSTFTSNEKIILQSSGSTLLDYKKVVVSVDQKLFEL